MLSASAVGFLTPLSRSDTMRRTLASCSGGTARYGPIEGRMRPTLLLADSCACDLIYLNYLICLPRASACACACLCAARPSTRPSRVPRV